MVSIFKALPFKYDKHEAMFPLELAERVVKLFSDVGDIVLDPFMGSGTTALAAIKNNRKYIGIEKESKYVNLAKNNINSFIRSLENEQLVLKFG